MSTKPSQPPNPSNASTSTLPSNQPHTVTSRTVHSPPPSMDTLQLAPDETRPRPSTPGSQCITILGFWLNANCNHSPWVIRTIRCALYDADCSRCKEEGCCEYTSSREGPWRASRRQRWLDMTLADGEKRTYTGCEECEPGERPVVRRVDILGRPV